MSTELFCLAAAAILSLLLPLIYGPANMSKVGINGALGNREEAPPRDGVGPRGVRAHANLTENLLPFAIAVLIAHVLQRRSGLSVLGAEIFLASRIVHAITYLMGITMVRTLAYLGGVIGTVMVFIQAFL